MFDKKGSLTVDKSTIDEDSLMEMVLEAGAEDMVVEETEYQVLTAPEDFSAVKETLTEKGVHFLESGIRMIPQNTVEITEEKTAQQVLNLLERLEDHDDVQNVYANFDIPDEIMENIS